MFEVKSNKSAHEARELERQRECGEQGNAQLRSRAAQPSSLACNKAEGGLFDHSSLTHIIYCAISTFNNRKNESVDPSH